MIFLTGANGFIGRHVVEALRDAGIAHRVLLSRPNEDFTARFPDTPTVVGDLLDEGTLDRGLEGATALLHLAAKNIDHDGSGFERVNVEGTRKLVERAGRAGTKRLLYLSSVGVYGHGSHRDADESTPRSPDTPFSRSKAAAEDLILARHRQDGTTATVLRHRFVYGEGDQAVMPRLIGAARKYRFWIGGGRALLSLVWARDLAHVLVRLAGDDAPDPGDHPVFHITDGRPIPYREVIGTICQTYGFQPPKISIPFPLLYVPVRLRERLLRIDPEVSQSSVTSLRLKFVAEDHAFSSRKLQGLLPDFEPTPFAEGFTACREYYARFAHPEENSP